MISAVLWVYFSAKAIPRHEAIATTRRATAIYRSVGIRIRARVRRSPVRLPRAIDERQRFALTDYAPYFPEHRKGEKVMLLVPPAQLPLIGTSISTGQGEICGNRAIVGVVTSDRLKTARNMNSAVIAHELGHMLGASHVGDASVMNPAPIPAAYSLRWHISISDFSLNEMMGCYERREY